MSGDERFQLFFYNRDAYREYRKLDGSVKRLVEVGYRKLMMRADEIGKPLGGALAGCKELKYRKDGLRVIFRICEDGGVDVVDIIVTGKREDGAAFRTAEKRLRGGPSERVGL
ncbi:type II toxin-antitoxin system RelE family toxin [Arabiibacter massiliensis]|uniref:type II toxin-antitoxin system RelE family toxin n=1 Tax=Arabiibacter massiliensis TaxID=1870985 RepID=UPI0009BC08CC|nr:hypothetical protein [Arabiibacter massiliensis]